MLDFLGRYCSLTLLRGALHLGGRVVVDGGLRAVLAGCEGGNVPGAGVGVGHRVGRERDNSCYHAGMAKTQLGARVDEDVAELAKRRAADLGLSVGDYLARLVQDDTSGLRAKAVGAAARFLADHQAVFDEAEQAQQAPRGEHAA